MKLEVFGGNRFYIAQNPPCRNGWEEFIRQEEDIVDPYDRMQDYEARVGEFLNAPFAIAQDSIFRLIFLKIRGKTFLQTLDELNHRKGFSFLLAHGGGKDKWYFRDGAERKPIQDWVDEVDGSCRVALINCCNPHNLEVKSINSLIIHPRDTIRRFQIALGLRSLRVYHPQKGYLN